MPLPAVLDYVLPALLHLYPSTPAAAQALVATCRMLGGHLMARHVAPLLLHWVALPKVGGRGVAWKGP